MVTATEFARKALHETPGQFAARMQRVEDYMNYKMGEGKSLQNLASEQHQRSSDLKALKGERLPK